MRRTVLHDRIEADLRRGESASLVGELEVLLVCDPFDERVAGQMMRALAGAGRQAEALQVYEKVRARLSDELGVDPSPVLQEVHLATLRGGFGAMHEAANLPQSRRTNLRSQLTSFVGREDEVRHIGEALDENRLVTLVGPGGAGKTRLAAEAAMRIVDTVPDGVWLVELAPVSSGTDVGNVVLNSVGLRDMTLRDRTATPSARDALAILLDGLADKELLLVLDNCEHLIEASAVLVDQLLSRCPGLRVLTTSREPLGILGEVLLAVLPFTQPVVDASPARSMEYPAVRLFAVRAAAVVPNFVIDDANVASVIEIVRRLDGLPLAIELAAARVRTIPLSDIADRLSDRFRLLTGGSRTALPRHRTLRAVVEWSWDLLSDTERELVEQLSIFSGGITADSAVGATGVDQQDAADLLASLADRSLLQPVDGGRRMRMLETIREYGAEQLAERGAITQARAGHARHFAKLAADAAPELLGFDQLPWFRIVTDERENILAAMRYLCDAGDVDGALRVAVTLGQYALMTGAYSEIVAWFVEALAVPGGVDEQLHVVAEAMHSLTVTTEARDEWAEDVERAQAKYADLANRLDKVDIAYSPLVPLLRGIVAFFSGAGDRMDEYSDEDLARMSPWTRASVSMMYATVAENSGDIEKERRHAQAAYDQFREVGERWGMSNALRLIGQLRTLDGDLEGAIDAMQEAMRLTGEIESRDDLGFMLGRLADLEIRREDFDAARGYIAQARAAADEHGDQMQTVFISAMLCAVEYASGNIEAARGLLARSRQLLSTLRATHPAFGHLQALLFATSARFDAHDGNMSSALELARVSYAAALETRDRPLLASIGVMTSYLAMMAGDFRRAATTLGAAARLRGSDDHTAWDVREIVEGLRAEVGDYEFESAYAEGKALDRDIAAERLAPK